MNFTVESCGNGGDESLELWPKEDMMAASSSDGTGGVGGSVRVATENKQEIFCNKKLILKQVGFLWNGTVVVVVDKFSSISVDFMRSEREVKKLCL